MTAYVHRYRSSHPALGPNIRGKKKIVSGTQNVNVVSRALTTSQSIQSFGLSNVAPALMTCQLLSSSSSA